MLKEIIYSRCAYDRVCKEGALGTRNYLSVSKKHLITIIPTDKATLSPDVLAVYTDAFGEITSLPQVIEKSEDFTFEKWVNVETNEEVKVGQVLSGDISITPQMKSHIKAKLHIGNVSSVVSRFSGITTVEFGTVNSPVNDSALYE